MKTQKIQEQITKKENQIKELKAKLIEQSNKNEFIFIPELKIEIEKSIHHKGKSYNELIKEFGKEYVEENLPTYAQLQFLRNSEKYKKILGLIDSWEFVKQEDEISKKNGYVAGFFAYSDCASLDCRNDSDVHYSSLGVRWVRKKF
jgi:hypothetical protein